MQSTMRHAQLIKGAVTVATHGCISKSNDDLQSTKHKTCERSETSQQLLDIV